MTAYWNGEFRPKEEIRISPDDRGFLFGDGAYEVICSYAGRLFKAKEHFDRLIRSLRELKIKTPDMAVLGRVPETLLHKNGLEKNWAVVYFQVTRGAAPRSHPFPDENTPITVYAFAAPLDLPEKELAEGVQVVMVPDNRWLRCDIKSVNLLPNVLASQTARESGAKDVLFVRDGAITEGSYTSFGAVYDGTVFTYPDSHYILPGITRSVVLDLCTQMKIPVEKYPVMADQVRAADECMLWGTTTQVMPIVQVDGAPIGDGQPGPITRKLQKALSELILDFNAATF
ncbi:MAG: D-amino acid aminotransferase [Desulfobacterales bacterium]|nr:D-amino acid aminotransferase [Desulfobacterales bacterium]